MPLEVHSGENLVPFLSATIMIDLTGIGVEVQAALAPQFNIEILNRTGDIGLTVVNGRINQVTIQKFPSRIGKKMACKILFSVRLLDRLWQRELKRPHAGRASVPLAVMDGTVAIWRFN